MALAGTGNGILTLSVAYGKRGALPAGENGMVGLLGLMGAVFAGFMVDALYLPDQTVLQEDGDAASGEQGGDVQGGGAGI